jgi:type II secretory pathway pseudopilin PulG
MKVAVNGEPVRTGSARVASGPIRTVRPSCASVSPRHLRRNTHRATGYTLLELLLVLAILVAVAGAVAPIMVARMAEYRLKQGAEAARAAISATRIHAIDVSSVYQFRFEPGGRRYLAIPTDADAFNSAQSGGLPRKSVEYGQLPEDLSFQIVAAPTSGTSAAPTSMMAGTTAAATDPAWSAAIAHVSNIGDFTSAVWSAPIVFRPDGTAMDAAVNVVDKTGDGFQLKVRELTGEVFVTRLTTGAL